MTPDEHYDEAEKWAARAARAWGSEDGGTHDDVIAHTAAAIAQVHATLATLTEPPLGVIDR